MSFSLKQIIQDTYKHKSLGFEDIKNTTISSDAGKILTKLYEHHKSGTLSPESIIFLETSKSIHHMVSILNKLSYFDLDTAIKEELELIYLNTNVNHKKITLNSIIEVIISDIGGVDKISDDNKPDILTKISQFILEARVYGDLDDDTNKVIKQPDYMDLLSQLINKIIESENIFESIKELYVNVLSREHDFLDEVARGHDISEVIEKITESEETMKSLIGELKNEFDMKLKFMLKTQFTDVHNHLNHIGQNIHIIGANLLDDGEDEYDDCTSDHCPLEGHKRLNEENRQKLNRDGSRSIDSNQRDNTSHSINRRRYNRDK